MKIKWWKLWAKALGEKALPINSDADKVAIIRTVLVLIQILTCFFIIGNVVRHW
jgi:hypothetical protein